MYLRFSLCHEYIDKTFFFFFFFYYWQTQHPTLTTKMKKNKKCSSLTSFKTALWNIEGFTAEKYNDPSFQKIISEFHVVSFIETWNDPNTCKVTLPEFELIAASCRKKHKKARRNSGGISIFVKNCLVPGIKQISNPHPDIVWIKIDKIFFNLKNDVFLAAVYISPENSSKNVSDIESVYSQLLADIEKFSNIGDIILQGDFNAYTQPDYVVADETNHPNLEDEQYIFDNSMPRNNLDPKRINNSGKFLLDICKETGLRILNGRSVGDLYGRNTCITYNGCSLVDYTLVSISLMNVIGCFEVGDFTIFSNHCPISC